MSVILQKDAPVLRETAKPVPASMFGTPKLKAIIKDMSETLATQDDGVAIAAPQIGLSLRIFVISGHALELIKTMDEDESTDTAADDTHAAKHAPKHPDLVFINPKLVRLSREKEEMEEGCLSVRYLYGKTHRSKKARIKAYDINGKAFELGGSGLLAQIFQHETDHLDGRLFIDIATDIHDLPPKK